ncbi:MAG TPA: LecA/PA-IL family lectin [Pyrinomonadaceae bacterium]|nr:LecA/PA-IL family lectin [Pyrinomonadaceae bacterium]
MKKIFLAFLIILGALSFAFADTIYLRDGRTIRGTLLGFVNGRFVVRVERRYANAEVEQNTEQNIDRNRRDRNNDIQYFRPEEIDRIEIEGRSLDEARYETRNVQVTLESNWIDSGVYLRRGEHVQVSATGVIIVGRSRIGPEGLRSTDPTAPLPNAAEGKLIGAIGNDSSAPIIEIGGNSEFTSDRNGRLFLTANRGSYADARGNFDVRIRSERELNAGNEDYGRGGVRSRGRDRGQDNTGGYSGNQRERTFDVPANNSRGLDTGIDLRAGEPITITATGTIVAGTRIGQVGPDGARSSGLGSIVSTRPLPSSGVGALIAYIRMANGNLSPPYLVGSNLNTSVPMDGRLILAVNDDNYNDNSGSFSVRVRYVP